MTPAKLDALNAHWHEQHKMWLQLPMTRYFFAAVSKRKQDLQDGAGEFSVTQPDTNKEHTNNVRAQEVKQLLKTYADPATNPYAIADPKHSIIPVNPDDAE